MYDFSRISGSKTVFVHRSFGAAKIGRVNECNGLVVILTTSTSFLNYKTLSYKPRGSYSEQLRAGASERIPIGARMPTIIPQPTKEEWCAIRAGTQTHPKLYTFSDPRQNAEPMREVARASRADLIRGNGPAAYEEAHRQWSNWRYYTEIAMGIPAKFVRLKSADHVEKFRVWCGQLLEFGCEPHEYIEAAIASMSKMRDYQSFRLGLNYMLCSGVVTDTFARIAATRTRPQQTADRHHSFQTSGVDRRMLDRIHVSLRNAGIDTNALTDQEIATMVEAAKALNSGRAGFIPSKIKTGAVALRELFNS